MTVLIIPSWYKTESNAILGSFFREQAMMLQRAGVDVIVADATFQGKKDYFSKRCFSLKTYDDEGILTYSYVVPAIGVGRLQSGGSKVFYRNIKKIYKKIIKDGHKIDLIHAHSYMPAGIAAVRLGKEKDIPVVITEHSSEIIQQNMTQKRKEYFKVVVSSANEFICVSNALKRSAQVLTDNVKYPIVIPNAVNKIFKFEKPGNYETFTFISIGNLVPSKRFDLTIEAFALAFKGNTKVRLEIVGVGPIKEKLEGLVRQQGIKEQVDFLGRIPREQVAMELQKSNVFVLPSDYETFGVVYIEAMACGLPVIGTKNGGAEDIISENNGYLIEKNNVGQLAQAMQSAYENYENYDRARIAEECQKRFGEKHIVDQILKIYHWYMEK